MNPEFFRLEMMRRIEAARALEEAYATPLICVARTAFGRCTETATHRLACAACGRHAGLICTVHAGALTTLPDCQDLLCGAKGTGSEINRLEAL
jgi:hypothetical protein